MAEKHALINGTAMPKQITLNDVNLVSEEFEKQYRDGVLEKAARRRRRGLSLRLLWGVAAALLLWLAALTAVRELQLRRLRGEVRALAADLLAAAASVRALHDKIDNNKILKELQILDDHIYTDEDDPAKSRGLSDGMPSSLDKLHDLTVVLEDDKSDDEGDFYPIDDEDDGDESGDWYPDYDKRERNGKTNMVHLEPKDFTSDVVLDEKDIRKIKKLLNENPEKDIGTGSWLDAPVELNKPSTESPATAQARDRRSVLPDAGASRNTVLDINDRRKSKKLEEEELDAPAPLHKISRTVRNSEAGQRRPFIAAHFHGNTSHLNPEVHEHYKGNGLVRVSHGAAHDVWYPAAWTSAAPPPRPSLTRNGHVHVRHSGVYFVYVQIYYLDSHDVVSWVLHRTNPELDARDTLLQCAQSAAGGARADRANSCFSAAALFLRAGDRLAVRNTGGDRHSIMQPEKSFIGLVQLADADDPDEEF